MTTALPASRSDRDRARLPRRVQLGIAALVAGTLVLAALTALHAWRAAQHQREAAAVLVAHQAAQAVRVAVADAERRLSRSLREGAAEILAARQQNGAAAEEVDAAALAELRARLDADAGPELAALGLLPSAAATAAGNPADGGPTALGTAVPVVSVVPLRSPEQSTADARHLRTTHLVDVAHLLSTPRSDLSLRLHASDPPQPAGYAADQGTAAGRDPLASVPLGIDPNQDWHLSVSASSSLLDPWLITTLGVLLLLGGTMLALLAGIAAPLRGLAQAATQAEHSARDRQQRLAAVLGATSEGILLATPEGRIEQINPAAEVLLGQLAEDLLNTNLRTLMPSLVHDAASEAEAGGDDLLPTRHDIDITRSDGQRFPARVWMRRVSLNDAPHRLLVIQDLTEPTRQAMQLEFLEQRDVITGLLNRKEFERRMERMLTEAVGSETPHVLCYIDIDQFKLVNDTAGHAAGDALIEQIATLIKVKFDQAALLARLGGDEYGALFAECTEQHALALCEGLVQTVRNFLFTWRDRSFDVGVSVGLTAFQPENDSAAAELAKADVACMMAKHEGRGRVHVYRDGDASAARHHGEMHLASAISQALNSGRFRLYAQPIMPLASGSAGRVHYEILVRMLDEQGAAVVPDQFIPAAERYILMPAVDRWIIHQLFSTQGEQLRAWHAEHPRQFLFAVNLSGTSLGDEGFLPFLKRQFETHRIPPSAICFEITETAAIRNLRGARGFMHTLTDMGCSFALDDFGSGLSSYNYLRELPVEYLKIDGSFVRDMNSNPVNHALVASINQIAHVLGLKTIAEWAEDDSTINQLRALNVDFVQGYAIGTPLPVVECRFDLSDVLETESARLD